mmetsp:Transcript_20838/g.51108  ORF Transcript_20838/g.51108 Transcript_20838/m.51108 type:complete len:120 (-) Transcript_20838:781-1140(-)
MIQLISRFADKGLSPSQIGLILRDSFSIIDVKNITGLNILKILHIKGIKTDVPEDLYHLLKKFKIMRKHLNFNRNDKAGRFKLRHLESHISRLSKFYKRKKFIPINWKYKEYIENKHFI